MVLEYLIFTGAGLQFLGGVAYIRDTLKGETKPNRVSWILFAAAPLLGITIALSEGANWIILLPVFMAGFMPLLIVCASFLNKNAYWHLDAFDYVCGGFSVLALILWLLVSLPLLALFFLIVADALAVLPTLRKAWAYPETETGLAWVAAFLATSLSLVAASKNWQFVEYAFPMYLVLATASVTFAIYRHHIFPKGAEQEVE